MNEAEDAYCMAMLQHYENFTVASRLAPRALRRDLARVYAFSRTTDDLGDESGEAAAATRRLTIWREEVTRLFDGDAPVHPVLVALRDTVERHALPAQPFLDLIDANLQDQRVAAYEDWPALLGYCRLSAAPVGRLVLRLFDIDSPRAVELSDDVCIGLQLANFAQDVSVDGRRGRTYLLQVDLRDLGDTGAVRAMCERARALLESGRELEAMTSSRLRLQLTLYRLGGEAILDAIVRANYDTAHTRPTVSAVRRVRIASAALLGLLNGRLGDAVGGHPGQRPAATRERPGRGPHGGRTRPSGMASPRRGRRGVPAAPGPGLLKRQWTPMAELATLPDLRASERYCEAMARREAANFYWGFVALPRPQRTAIYALYDFARQVDDDADLDGSASRAERLERHRRRLRDARAGDTTDPVMSVLAGAMARYAIPSAEVEMLIDGVAMDLDTARYRTWPELREYCRLVASVVGRMCVRIFGFRDPVALQRADDLGIALQLINILRDVREDAARGRIYLPLDELAAFDISEDDVLRGRATPSWPRFVASQSARAREHYMSGLRVTAHIPTSSAVCVRTMAGIYLRILERIEAEPALPLRHRASLSPAVKLGVMARSWIAAL